MRALDILAASRRDARAQLLVTTSGADSQTTIVEEYDGVAGQGSKRAGRLGSGAGFVSQSGHEQADPIVGRVCGE
jgi:hypothetical protein